MPACAARRTVLQKVRGCALKHFHSLWARGFRFSFTPLPGSFSPFPHGTVLYRSLWVFSLGGWSPLLPTRFHVSRSTLVPPESDLFTHTGLSPPLVCFPKTVLLKDLLRMAARNPVMLASRFGLLRVRSPLLTESIFLSFPPGT